MKPALIFLLCSGGWSLAVTPKAVTLQTDGIEATLPRSTADHCKGRRECYQAGEFVVNLSRDKRVAWINTDAGDIVGLGERLACRATSPAPASTEH